MLGHLLYASCFAVTALSHSDDPVIVKQVKMQRPGLPIPEVPILSSVNGQLQTTLRLSAAKLVGLNMSLITRMLNGTMPGPTLVMNPGDRLYIKYSNALGANHGPKQSNTYHQPNTTNLHVHGLHVSPLAPADDIFGMVAPPGESLQYEYKLPSDHSPGTYWLHPHHHGSLVLQAGAGAASALIVRDPPGYLSPQLEAMQEHVIVLQNLPVSQLQLAAKVSHDELFTTTGMESHQDLWLANGAPQPTLTMQPAEWRRLRFVMAGVNRSLSLDFGTCEVALLAKDGVYIDDFPRFVPRVYLPPGGRADVVVRCPETSQQILRSIKSPTDDWGVGFGGPLLQLRTKGPQALGLAARELVAWKPAVRPSYLQDLTGFMVAPDCSCRTELGGGAQDRLIDGHMFGGSKRYLHQWPRDAVVERRLAGVDYHTFHQHTWPFQLLNTPKGNNPFFKSGDWHDTYQNLQDFEAIVRFSTVDYFGPEVVHCHSLTHEDKGMIGAEIVRGRGPDACFCDLLGAVSFDDGTGPSDQPGRYLLHATALCVLAMIIIFTAIMFQVTRVSQTVTSGGYIKLIDS